MESGVLHSIARKIVRESVMIVYRTLQASRYLKTKHYGVIVCDSFSLILIHGDESGQLSTLSHMPITKDDISDLLESVCKRGVTGKIYIACCFTKQAAKRYGESYFAPFLLSNCDELFVRSHDSIVSYGIWKEHNPYHGFMAMG